MPRRDDRRLSSRATRSEETRTKRLSFGCVVEFHGLSLAYASSCGPFEYICSRGLSLLCPESKRKNDWVTLGGSSKQLRSDQDKGYRLEPRLSACTIGPARPSRAVAPSPTVGFQGGAIATRRDRSGFSSRVVSGNAQPARPRYDSLQSMDPWRRSNILLGSSRHAMRSMNSFGLCFCRHGYRKIN